MRVKRRAMQDGKSERRRHGVVRHGHGGSGRRDGIASLWERTDARFSLTVQASDATGWSAAAHRSIDRLHVQERTLAAIIKRRSVARTSRKSYRRALHGHPGTGGGRRTAPAG